MSYEIWHDLLGAFTTHDEVIDAFADAGLGKPPAIDAGSKTLYDVGDGLTLSISQPRYYCSEHAELPATTGVLSSVTMWLAGRAKLSG